MRPSDENLITCTRGHTTARKLWHLFDMDPAYLCCPVCGELSDVNVPEIAQPSQSSPVPIGRRAIHVVSLIRKVEAWAQSRRSAGFGSGCLSEVVKYLGEYRDLLAASDVELATGYDLDRLLDPLSREPVIEPGYGMRPETDAEFRARAGKLPVVKVGQASQSRCTMCNEQILYGRDHACAKGGRVVWDGGRSIQFEPRQIADHVDPPVRV
jgi:hypothetical protein